MVNQNQDFWIVGSRLYFRKRNAIKANGNSAWIDLGVVQSATPATTIERLALDDPDGGTRQEVDSRATKVTEQYTVVTNNLSARNRAIAYLSDYPDDTEIDSLFTSSVVAGFPGMLARPETGDGEPAVGLAGVAYVIDVTNTATPDTPLVPTFTAFEVTAIDSGLGTIEVDDATGLVADDLFVVTNTQSGGGTVMTDEEAANVGTYKIESISGTTLTIDSAGRSRMSEDVTGIQVVGQTVSGAGVTLLEPGVDYNVTNANRGIVQMISVAEGGAFAGDSAGQDGAGDLMIGYQQKAIGKYRRFVPNTKTVIEGEIDLMYSRDSFQDESRRYAPKASITFNSSSLSAEDYSTLTFDVTVLKDDTRNTEKTGHFMDHSGPDRRLS